MKYFFVVFLQLWGIGFCQTTETKQSLFKQKSVPKTELRNVPETLIDSVLLMDGILDVVDLITNGSISFCGHGAKTAATAAVEGVGLELKKVDSFIPILPDQCIEPPAECPNKNITFWYSSRYQADNPIELSLTDLNSFLQVEENNKPWKIIIHGYTKSKDEIPNPQLKSAYYKRGEYNIISVDYEPLARDGCYLQAVHNVPLISKCTAQLIDAMVDRDLIKMENLHVIGFSLGAQVAGQIHEYLFNGVPKRITGLDPASPLFDGVVNNNLSRNAGTYVDVIHTNGMLKGKIEPLGHADFYVNGGLIQPGCLLNNNGSISTCSHDRSPLYFAESINSVEGFWGVPCDSYLKFMSGSCDVEEDDLVLMGEDIPYGTRGVFHLQTRSSAPFAIGKQPGPITW